MTMEGTELWMDMMDEKTAIQKERQALQRVETDINKLRDEIEDLVAVADEMDVQTAHEIAGTNAVRFNVTLWFAEYPSHFKWLAKHGHWEVTLRESTGIEEHEYVIDAEATAGEGI